MANDILLGLIRLNLVAAAAILAVLALREPLRRIAGAKVAYALWLAVPIAVLASLIPPRTIVTILPEVTTLAPVAAQPGGMIAGAADVLIPAPAASFTDWSLVAIGVWAVGAVAGVMWLVWRQRQFLAVVGGVERWGQTLKAIRSSVGPAVIGVLSPKILVPSDFEDRFSPRERDVVMAHERFHLAQGHAQTNALVLLTQCLNWFNPLIHVAGRILRLDQELACDAAVVARFPNARRSYAEAMLKTQLAPTALPLGCYWPARGSSALRRRLAMLQVVAPPRGRMLAGAAAAVLITTAAGVAAWAAQTPQRVTVTAQSSARPTPRAEPQAASAVSSVQSPAPVAAPNKPATPVDLEAQHRAEFEEAQKMRAASLAELVAQRDAIAVQAEAAQARQTVFEAKPDYVPAVAAQSARIETLALAGARLGIEKAISGLKQPQIYRPLPQIEPGYVLKFETEAKVSGLDKPIGGQLRYVGGEEWTSGSIRGEGQRYALATHARQVGDKIELEPHLYLDGQLIATGKALLTSGGSASIRLSNGQVVIASATLERDASASWQRAAYDSTPVTRSFEWNGGDALTVNVPAEVVFSQGRRASVTIKGPAEILDNLDIDEGTITVDRDFGGRNWRNTGPFPGQLTITITAPDVTSFNLNAQGSHLSVRNYDQDEIMIRAPGARSAIDVAGRTGEINLHLPGNGTIDLSRLKATSAKIDVPGSGTVSVGARDEVRVRISGTGQVRLLNTPGKLDQKVTGRGSVIAPPS